MRVGRIIAKAISGARRADAKSWELMKRWLKRGSVVEPADRGLHWLETDALLNDEEESAGPPLDMEQ